MISVVGVMVLVVVVFNGVCRCHGCTVVVIVVVLVVVVVVLL